MSFTLIAERLHQTIPTGKAVLDGGSRSIDKNENRSLFRGFDHVLKLPLLRIGLFDPLQTSPMRDE